MLPLHIAFLLSSIFVLLSLGHSNALILSGHLNTHQNWAFLARFCFLTEKGTFRYVFDLGNRQDSVNLLLYYDAIDQWPAVYPSNKTCREKQSILSTENGQLVPLSIYQPRQSGCTVQNGTVRCDSYRKFRSAHPRWWFIVLADCSTITGLNVTYWMSLTNGSPDQFWKKHFSADEFYILPILITAACIYVILITASFYVAWQLRSRRLLHISYKIFMTSLICQLLGVLVELHSYVNLGLRGTLLSNTLLIGHLFEACSELLYTILLLLLAFGYTVTKSVLTATQTKYLTIFMCVNAACQFSLYIYQSQIFDPGLVLYIYESPPGYTLIVLKLITWVVFVIRCFRTTKKMSSKLHFYGSLLSLGSAWFLCHPLSVLIVTFLIDKWIRESVAKGCCLWIIFLGHVTFLYVTRPSIANTRFPFHIRTCQVLPIGGEGQDHSYEPRTQTAVSAFTISHVTPSSGENFSK